jgi:hemerythrin
MNTPYFVWDAELYSIGNPTIDQQHQRLLSVLNRLYLLIHGDGGIDNSAGTAAMMQELTYFIVEHFAFEEQLMQESDYPLERLAQHRAEHNAFIIKVQSFEERLQSGDPTVLADMLPYLYGDWLIQHICVSDMDYVPYLRPPVATVTAGEAA